jgi:hypothetical protein
MPEDLLIGRRVTPHQLFDRELTETYLSALDDAMGSAEADRVPQDHRRRLGRRPGADPSRLAVQPLRRAVVDAGQPAAAAGAARPGAGRGRGVARAVRQRVGVRAGALQRPQADGGSPPRELVSTFGHKWHTCPASRFPITAIRTAVRALLDAWDLQPLFTDVQPRKQQIGGVARAAKPVQAAARAGRKEFPLCGPPLCRSHCRSLRLVRAGVVSGTHKDPRQRVGPPGDLGRPTRIFAGGFGPCGRPDPQRSWRTGRRYPVR